MIEDILEVMNSGNGQISYFAKVDFRNDNSLFGILQSDRMFGTYILGKTGTGKTNLLETFIYLDIAHHRGCCVIDIHGDMILNVIKRVPNERKSDLVYIDLSSPNNEWGYNPLRKVSYPYRHLITSHIIETFQKIWTGNAWGVKLEHILRNVLLTLLDQDKMSFSDIVPLLTDEHFRARCEPFIQSEEVRNFWKYEFPKYSKHDILPVLNKVSSFLTVPIVKKVLVENTKQLVLSDIMNQGKILLINLAKGRVGEDSAKLLGSLILGGISSAGFHRSMLPPQERKPFFVYLDEFHHFTTLSLVNMFSELRKFQIGFIVAHQYIAQLSHAIRDAVFGNIGTIISFRISYHDAKYMAQEFYPTFSAHDLMSLENYHIYLKLMIRGKPSNPFSARTIHVPFSQTLPKF